MNSLKHLFLLAARTLGFFRLARYFTRNDWRILAYHGIWLGPGHFGNHLFMQADTFRRRLELVKDGGYSVVSLRDLLENNTGSGAAVAITIDDGWRGTYEHMLPALENVGFPATLYLYTAYVDSQLPVATVTFGYLIERAGARGLTKASCPGDSDNTPLNLAEFANWGLEQLRTLDTVQQRDEFLESLSAQLGESLEEIRGGNWLKLMTAEQVADAHQRGFDIQLHTHNHRTTFNNSEVLTQEIDENRARIFALTGVQADQFCYPSGVHKPGDYRILEEVGVRSATTTVQGLANARANRYALPRIMDSENISDLEFEAELCGFLPLLRKKLRSNAPAA